MKSFFYLIFLMLFSVAFLFAENGVVHYEDTFQVRTDDLRIELNIDGAKVKVFCNNKRNDCYVSLRYNDEKSNGDVRFNKARGTLKISIDTGFWPWNKNKSGNGYTPELRVELPYHPNINLDSRIKAGEINFEFDAIRLTDFKFRNWAGETTVDFPMPNRVKMNTFDVNCKVGEVKLLNLGNANFEEGDINGGIGELSLDFNGDLPKKTMARIDLDIGETNIRIPERVGSKLRISKSFIIAEINVPPWFRKEGHYYYSENYNSAENSLYLIISTGLGELLINVD